ncbi:MAG TPA: hypothetical protein PLD23_06390 [Armatimonadota bacterium]|nr:hypothetical protein [Armatimonadota bacterium]
MWRHARGVCLLVLTLALVSAGCGPGTVTAGDLTFQQRSDAIDAVEAHAASLPGGDHAATLASVAAYMRSHPEFAESGVSEEYGCTWARFVDGRILVFRDDPPPTAGESIVGDRGCTGTLRTGQPVGKARVLQCLSGYVDATPWLRDWLRSAGYDVSADLENPTVERLRSVQGQDGVFFISTHGGGGVAERGQGPLFCLMTTTPVTDENDRRYESDLKDHSLMILDCLGTPTTRVRRYAITAKFVRDHMRFGPNSLVYVDACYSNDREFREACFDAGASLYAGWTGAVLDWVSARAALFMFDRMLGANATTASEVPPQRPFDYARAYSDLVTRGWHRNPTGIMPSAAEASCGRDLIVNPTVPTLVFTPGPTGDCGALAPSIEFAKVDELPDDAPPGTSHLTVFGQFGDDPGEGQRSVTLDGTSLRVLSWTPCEVTCEIPATGPGFSGNVQLAHRGHRSNVVPLTSWWVRVHYALDYFDGACTDEFDLLIHLRFDVHGYRREPADQRWRYPLAQFDHYESGLSVGQDSSGTWSASGQWSETWPVTGGDNPEYATRYHQYAGGGNLAFGPPTVGGSYVAGTAQLRFDTGTHSSGVVVEPPRTLYIRLRLSAGATGKTDTVSMSTGPGSITEPSPLSGLSDVEMDLIIDDNYHIQAGRALAVPSLGESAGVVQWLESVPTNAPDAATARVRLP